MVENTYLAHHGVKGMRWGVRRYQNKDGSLTSEGKRKYGYGHNYNQDLIISRGSTVSRISYTNKETNSGRTYAAYKNKDINEYKRLGKSMADVFGSTAYQYKFRTKENLRLPSRKKKVDAYIQYLSKDNSYFSKRIVNSSRAKQEKKFDRFEYKLVKSRDSKKWKSRSNKYFNTLRSNGYNAMLDDADMRRKISNSPIIVFDRGKSLTLQSVNDLSDYKVSDNYFKKKK